MGERKRRRVATAGKLKSQVEIERTARWVELPREIVAMIASFTCMPMQPMPFTCLAHTADPDSLAYHRQEDRSLFGLGSQFTPGQDHMPHGPGPMGHMGSVSDMPSAVGAPAPGSVGPSSSPSANSPAGTPDGRGGSGTIPGTFWPHRISETALAMRCVCRSWCEVLSEGVRRVMLPGRETYTMCAKHFPKLSHLALGSCSDLLVWSPDQPAVQSSRRRRAVRSNETGPGSSSKAAAAVVECISDNRRRSNRLTTARSATTAAAATTGSSNAPARSSHRSSSGGGAAQPIAWRSLAALTSLRNLQVTDSSVHLDLAATCPLLEELVVWTQHQPEYGTHAGRDTYGLMGTFNSGMPRGRGTAGRRDAPSTRRSALDRILSNLPRLRRLRLSGIDASAGRLGLALMELTELTSLRLLQCRPPTFFGSARSGRARSGNNNFNNFGRDLMLNLGAKLQDLSLQGCCIRQLPEEFLAGLTGLRMLDLSSNWMDSLPASVTLLQRLEYLDVQHNAINSLPDGFAAMSRLADLDLSGNYIHRLPADFGQLTTLTHLHLGGLHGLDIQACLPLLTSLTNLHSLGLSDVDLSVDDMELDGDGDGEIQRVTQGPLHELVSALGPAGCLRELLLDGCGLDTLPACFSMLTSLSHLSLMENFDASGLPDTITCLRGLEVLRLGYLDLAAQLPDSLFDLIALRELDLEQNFLPYVSPDISKLSNLQILNLIDSLDPDAPREGIPWPSIYNLSMLRSLMVSGQDNNHQVPRGIGALTLLEALQLCCVELTLDVMEEMCSSLLNLRTLDLANCGITALPGSITSLRRLTELDLSDNLLTRLPPSFGRLTRLTEFALRGNHYVRSLPVDVTSLTRLRSFSWTVHRSHTISPSSALLSWLAKIPDLALIGEHNFVELAKSHGIPWRQRNLRRR